LLNGFLFCKLIIGNNIGHSNDTVMIAMTYLRNHLAIYVQVLGTFKLMLWIDMFVI